MDSGSTDETIAIAREYTAKIYDVPWHGFGAQKNIALSKASSDWILSLDADEIVTEALREEILLSINSEAFDAYYLFRKSTYCNQVMHYGDWQNDKCLRLFKKGMGHFKEVPVHEELLVDGRKGVLKNYLIHHSILQLEDAIEKMNRYSTLGAQHKYQQGKKSNMRTAILRGLWTFFRGYFLKGGFLDGRKGFMLAFSNAESCYYRYLKMMLMDHKSTADSQ